MIKHGVGYGGVWWGLGDGIGVLPGDGGDDGACVGLMSGDAWGAVVFVYGCINTA